MDSAPAANRMGEPEEPHGHTEAVPHHAVPYYWIFGYLVFLTAVTVGIAFWRAPNELINVLLALLIATIKATFVARFFMHLKFEGKLIWVIFIAPLILCVLLMMALIPDVGRGRTHGVNDMVSWFDRMFPPAKESGQGVP